MLELLLIAQVVAAPVVVHPVVTESTEPINTTVTLPTPLTTPFIPALNSPPVPQISEGTGGRIPVTPFPEPPASDTTAPIVTPESNPLP